MKLSATTSAHRRTHRRTHRRIRILLATAAAATVLLTGCNEDLSPRAEGVDPAPAAGSAAPVAPAPIAPALETGSATDDLSDFPLTAGWPTTPHEPSYGGIVFPVDDLENSFADTACGTTAPSADTTSTLRGELTDVEYHASRELLVFADADAAVAYLADLHSFYEGCEIPPSDGASHPVRVLETEVGGASFTAIRTTVREDGATELATSVQQAVRVGRAILLDASYGEGLVDDDESAREYAGYSTEKTVEVVAAMCAFTQAGC